MGCVEKFVGFRKLEINYLPKINIIEATLGLLHLT